MQVDPVRDFEHSRRLWRQKLAVEGILRDVLGWGPYVTLRPRVESMLRNLDKRVADFERAVLGHVVEANVEGQDALPAFCTVQELTPQMSAVGGPAVLSGAQ